MTDVLVVGAGPAGLAAAGYALRAGARVTVLDASHQTGGQYYRHQAGDDGALHHNWRTYLALRDELAGCEVLTGAHVWSVETPRVHVVYGDADGTGRETRTFQPDALVLATGAHDRTLPFPGWHLPGVYTAGAAQALAKGERLAVGRRVVVAGAGPFLLPVARALQHVGARVTGVYEASRVGALANGWLGAPWQYLPVAAKVTELAGYLGTHLRHRIPYLPGRGVVAAHGSERVEAVTVARLTRDWAPVPGTERTVDADAVCVTHGFTPRLELAVAAGCEIATPPAGVAYRHVRVDPAQRTSVPGVWAAGEVTGVGGADLAMAEGAVAGHCAAGGHLDDVRDVLARRTAYRRFAARMHDVHGVGRDWSGWLTPGTYVCRCERVSYRRLRDAVVETGTAGLRSLRLSSRAGLGLCQGRVCGRTVDELFARIATAPGAGTFADDASSDRRPVSVPIRVGELADVTPDEQRG